MLLAEAAPVDSFTRRCAYTLPVRAPYSHPIVAALATLLLLGCARPAAAPLDVVLITIDTLRADALGAYGQALPVSPFLDRLAREGVVFEQCTTASPLTLPSHASILTGLFPFAHGARGNEGYVLAPRHQTLAEILREHGYQTAAQVAVPVIGRRTQIGQGFDRFGDLSSPLAKRQRVSVEGRDHPIAMRGAWDITRHAIRALEESGDAPLFLWLHYFDPHRPYLQPDRFLEIAQGSDYHAEVAYVDEQLARLHAALAERGRLERTLLVVTADHGEARGDHGEGTHGYLVYEATMRVPLVFWSPTLLTPRHIDGATAVARTVDVAPTVLDLLGLPVPAGLHGRSLAPVIQGTADGADPLAYGETLEPLSLFGSSILRFARRGRWKYIHKHEPELYDLSADPAELNDVIDAHPEIARDLEASLLELVSGSASSEDAFTPVDEDTRAQLRALGYATGATPLRVASELATLAARGPDPNATLGDYREYLRASNELEIGRADLAWPRLASLRERHPGSVLIARSAVSALEALGREDEAVALRRHLGEIEAAEAAVPATTIQPPSLPGRGTLRESSQDPKEAR